MATKEGQFYKGLVGNLVFRVMNNKQIVQTRVQKGSIKHSIATKKSNKTFGMASTLAAAIRSTLPRLLVAISDFSMGGRLCGNIFRMFSEQRDKKTGRYNFALDSFQMLAGFNFNQSHPVEKRLLRMPAVIWNEGLLVVSFSATDGPAVLKFPYNSYGCRIRVGVSLFRLGDGKVAQKLVTAEKTLLQVDAPFDSFEFKFKVPDGCLYVVTLWLEYLIVNSLGERVYNRPGLNSACIIEAKITDGEYSANDQYHWRDMLVFK
jgi:hypothetical protein